MFKFFAIALLLFCSSIEATPIDFDSIKKINTIHYKGKNKVIKLVCTSKTRHVSKESSYYKLIKIDNNNSLIYIDSFTVLTYKVINDSLFYKHRDSLSYTFYQAISKENDWQNWIFSNHLFFLNYFPIAENKSFWGKEFKTPKISIQNDYLRYTQRSKNNKIIRDLYFNQDYILIGAEYINIDKNSITEKFTVNYEIFENSSIEGIANIKEYGPFRKNVKAYIKELPIKDTFKSNVFPVISDQIRLKKIDTQKIKYYVIDFWYISCGPCHLLRKELEKLATKYNKSNVYFFGFNAYDTYQDVLNFTKLKHLKIDEIDRTLGKLSQYVYTSHPTTLVLDSDLNIISMFKGYSIENIKKIEQLLLSLKRF